MNRRKAREQAFLLIFESSFQDLTAEQLIENAKDARQAEVDDYVIKAVNTVLEDRNRYDEIISKYSTKWKIDRISKVALAVLRLAIYEIQMEENIPVSVSINEAVELTKQYAGNDDFAFVNGLLGMYVKEEKITKTSNQAGLPKPDKENKSEK